MKVLKFGGTSVGSAKRMADVYDIIQSTPGKKLVVLSAMSGTTNTLVRVCEHFQSKEPVIVLFYFFVKWLTWPFAADQILPLPWSPLLNEIRRAFESTQTTVLLRRGLMCSVSVRILMVL